VDKLEVQLNELRMVLPEEKDVADLLRRIQVMATESDLTIRGFTPRAVVSRQVYVEWPIGLQLEGTYHNLGRFLERISKFPRIINVTGLNVKAMESPTRSGTVLAECTAMTFVMTEPKADEKDPKAPASPAAAKPAGARAE
jgi:type IV pilus assembly protein PilO